MTPGQKIKATLVCEIAHIHKEIITKDNVDQLFNEYKYDLLNLVHDFYIGEFETDIEPEYFWGYKNKSVGAKMYTGELVGWTYIYGLIREFYDCSWMDEAYFIDENKVKISTLKF